jgi:hypothetical protein
MSESFCVIFSVFGPMVLEKIFLNDFILFLHFCVYLFFEEDLAFNLYHLEFHLCKDDVNKFLLKLAN